MEYKLLFLGFCLIISAHLMTLKKPSDVKQHVITVKSQNNNLPQYTEGFVTPDKKINTINNMQNKFSNTNIQSNNSALPQQSLTQETPQSVQIKTDHNESTSNSQEIVFNEKIDEIIAAQTADNNEEINMKMEELVYKYSTNEQREEHEKDLKRIEHQIFSLN